MQMLAESEPGAKNHGGQAASRLSDLPQSSPCSSQPPHPQRPDHACHPCQDHHSHTQDIEPLLVCHGPAWPHHLQAWQQATYPFPSPRVKSQESRERSQAKVRGIAQHATNNFQLLDVQQIHTLLSSQAPTNAAKHLQILLCRLPPVIMLFIRGAFFVAVSHVTHYSVQNSFWVSVSNGCIF